MAENKKTAATSFPASGLAALCLGEVSKKCKVIEILSLKIRIKPEQLKKT